MSEIIGRAKHITGDKHLLNKDEQICGLLTIKGREDDYKILKEKTVRKSCLNKV